MPDLFGRLKGIFTLIRLPNLLLIGLTQCLCWYFLVQPYQQQPALAWPWIAWLVLSTLLIAAAGNMINDYFDLRIDTINKPERVTIERVFSRRQIIIWHILLNLASLAIAFYLALHLVLLRMMLVQFACVLLLLIYSTSLKRRLLVGNLSISLLTAITLLVIGAYEPGFSILNISKPEVKMLWVFTVFAFLMTLVREIVKDMEDIKGDAAEECRTLPLVAGIMVAKKVVTGLLIMQILLLLLVSVRVWDDHKILVLQWLLTVIVPIIWSVIALRKAGKSTDYRHLSRSLKWITFAGILSMIWA